MRAVGVFELVAGQADDVLQARVRALVVVVVVWLLLGEVFWQIVDRQHGRVDERLVGLGSIVSPSSPPQAARASIEETNITPTRRIASP